MSLVFKHALKYILMMGCHTLPFILFVSNYPNKEKFFQIWIISATSSFIYLQFIA